MTGPEHWHGAERHLEAAAGHCDRCEAGEMGYELGCAQVHALLALTAAIALPAGDWEQWHAAIRGETHEETR